jgi:AT hook motif
MIKSHARVRLKAILKRRVEMEKRKPASDDAPRPRGRPPLNKDEPARPRGRPPKAVAEEAPARRSRARDEDSNGSDYPYGVQEFAKELDVSEPSARRILRDLEVKKPGKRYGWPTKEKMMSDVKRAG